MKLAFINENKLYLSLFYIFWNKKKRILKNNDSNSRIMVEVMTLDEAIKGNDPSILQNKL